MFKSKTPLIIIWCLMFALSVFLVLFIPKTISSKVLIAFVFTCIAYISQILMWLWQIQKRQRPKSNFYDATIIVISFMYLMAASLFSILGVYFKNYVSDRLLITVYVIITVIAWIVIIALLNTKGYVNHVDSKQKEHHVEL